MIVEEYQQLGQCLGDASTWHGLVYGCLRENRQETNRFHGKKHGNYGKIPLFPVDFPETNLLIGDLETTREWRLPISHLLYRIRFWVFTALRMILPNGFWIGTYAYRNLPDAFFQSITTWNNPTALKTQYTVYSVHSILLPSLNYIELSYGLGNAIQKNIPCKYIQI